jgi:hypothetical protein
MAELSRSPVESPRACVLRQLRSTPLPSRGTRVEFSVPGATVVSNGQRPDQVRKRGVAFVSVASAFKGSPRSMLLPTLQYVKQAARKEVCSRLAKRFAVRSAPVVSTQRHCPVAFVALRVVKVPIASPQVRH